MSDNKNRIPGQIELESLTVTLTVLCLLKL